MSERSNKFKTRFKKMIIFGQEWGEEKGIDFDDRFMNGKDFRQSYTILWFSNGHIPNLVQL